MPRFAIKAPLQNVSFAGIFNAFSPFPNPIWHFLDFHFCFKRPRGASTVTVAVVPALSINAAKLAVEAAECDHQRPQRGTKAGKSHCRNPSNLAA